MSYYFIAQINIKDPKEYQKYLDKAGSIFKKYQGKYLVLDDNPEVLEGSWNGNRTVIIEFKTQSEFKAWYNSNEYQEILIHRLNAAECNSILAKGLDDDD
jgi:uncharacterized protein (DUF1330 family)